MEKALNIGLAGCGTVGGGVWKHHLENADLLAHRTGARLRIKRVADQNHARTRELGIPDAVVTSDWKDLINDPEIQVVVELIGGTTIAREMITEALKKGKHVVTANKALLADAGSELFELAEKNRVRLLFEASVAGGIPIIKALREGLVANRIVSIHGIINGTCNYILTQMRDQNRDYADVLAEAKKLGYAEANESLDVDGHDAAHKAAILAAIAHGLWIRHDDLHTEGIRSIERQDIAYARDLGYELKLLGIIKGDPDGAVEARVHPTLIPRNHVLASINGVFNGVCVRGDVVGDTLFYGRGAGASPTASAVLADLCELAQDWVAGNARPSGVQKSRGKRLKPVSDVISRYYLRLSVIDKPGVLARVATVLGNHSIGISSVIQPERKGREDHVPLIIMLHDARESEFQKARQEIEKLESVKAPTVWLRVEDFD